MTTYVDLETVSEADVSLTDFDMIIVGGGAAGLTIVREMARCGLKIAVIESGSIDETPFHEELNKVEVTQSLMEEEFVERRRIQHGHQLKTWDPAIQRFGVRCRVLGGSTAGWAGKVASFDAIDYEARSWIGSDNWPVSHEEMSSYVERAAQHLDLGPLIQDDAFWQFGVRKMPSEFARLERFRPFFWQFARSRNALTDVMRFGPDFLAEHFDNVTVLLNATAANIRLSNDTVTGVEVISSLTSRNRIAVSSSVVILASGAIENARLLLLSQDASPALQRSEALGRYLMDHPSIRLGSFSESEKQRAAKLLGFYPVLQNYRVYMYSCGLALTEDTQRTCEMPNMALFLGVTIAQDDPLQALARLAKFKTSDLLKDSYVVCRNIGFVLSSVGQKILNYRRIPMRLRRLIVDAAVFLNANIVARDYSGNGRGRKLDSVSLHLISEQPPSAENRITLSDNTDHLGLRLAKIDWNISSSLRKHMIQFTEFLEEEFTHTGIKGFELDPAFRDADSSALILCDMAHTAGTTRMGRHAADSVVDASLQVHGVQGLFAVGASVFPSSGHANPTLVILALAIRLSDHIKKMTRVPRAKYDANIKRDSLPLVVVTESSGELRRAVVDCLISRGYRVRCQYRGERPSDADCEWIECDFSREDLANIVIDKLLDGASAVIYLTASHANVDQMQAANVVNLNRLANAGEAKGITYFGLESSMVVYGSPTTRFVTEHTKRIDINRPINKQYFADRFMCEYARSKVMGEDLISGFGERMHVDIYRVAVEQNKAGWYDCLNWKRVRTLFSIYRNSHFISTENVANAIIHLMERARAGAPSGVEIYNIADAAAPTFADIYRTAGRKIGVSIPVVIDILKGILISRRLSLRYPMGFFRLDDRKLRDTGFVFDEHRTQMSARAVILTDANIDEPFNDGEGAKDVIRDMA